MIIDFDGRVLTVPAHVEQEVINQVYAMIKDKVYPQIPQPGRIAMMMYSRGKLRDMEIALNAAGYDGKKVRPPTGDDPNLHYLKIMLAETLRDMSNAVLEITTEQGTDTVKSFSLPIDNQG